MNLARRPVLGAGAATVAATLLGGCGDDGTPPVASSSPARTSAPPTAGSSGAVLAKLADVPVGGAVSAKAADGSPIIIAQPTQGTAVAFSAKCTHKGCTVAPSGDKLNCPCHGSVFEALTGKNIGGPAPSPLVPVTVTVKGGDVVAG